VDKEMENSALHHSSQPHQNQSQNQNQNSNDTREFKSQYRLFFPGMMAPPPLSSQNSNSNTSPSRIDHLVDGDGDGDGEGFASYSPVATDFLVFNFESVLGIDATAVR
jgi:hypothetical protein